MPDARKRTALLEREAAVLTALRDGDIAAAVTGVMELSGLPHTSAELAQRLGAARSEVAATLNRSAFERIKRDKETSFITAEGATRIREAIEKTLLAFHADNPDQVDMSVATLREQATPHLDGELFDAFFAQLVEGKLLTSEAGRVHHNHAPQTARLEQTRLVEQALPLLEGQSLSPDSLGDLALRLKTDTKTLSRALAPSVDEGALVRLGGDLYFTPAALGRGAGLIRSYFAHGGSTSPDKDGATDSTGATAAQLRDVLGVSRKYAIPLLEYYDRTALTRREGDLRFLR
jgi:selenocysteine-specific elongation factor